MSTKWLGWRWKRWLAEWLIFSVLARLGYGTQMQIAREDGSVLAITLALSAADFHVTHTDIMWAEFPFTDGEFRAESTLPYEVSNGDVH